MRAAFENIRTYCFLEQMVSGCCVIFLCLYVPNSNFSPLSYLGDYFEWALEMWIWFFHPSVFSQLCGQEGYFDCFLTVLWEDIGCPVKFNGILPFCTGNDRMWKLKKSNKQTPKPQLYFINSKLFKNYVTYIMSVPEVTEFVES